MLKTFPKCDKLPVMSMFDAHCSVSGRLQSAISSSREHEDKYQATHPNLRKLDTGGKKACMDSSNADVYGKLV